MNDDTEVRLRCLEAASKTPMVHLEGHAAGVLEAAKQWAEWVLGPPPPAGKNTLHLKK